MLTLSYPKQHVHTENDVLQAAADLAGVASVRLPHHILGGRLVRHRCGAIVFRSGQFTCGGCGYEGWGVMLAFMLRC